MKYSVWKLVGQHVIASLILWNLSVISMDTKALTYQAQVENRSRQQANRVIGNCFEKIGRPVACISGVGSVTTALSSLWISLEIAIRRGSLRTCSFPYFSDGRETGVILENRYDRLCTANKALLVFLCTCYIGDRIRTYGYKLCKPLSNNLTSISGRDVALDAPDSNDTCYIALSNNNDQESSTNEQQILPKEDVDCTPFNQALIAKTTGNMLKRVGVNVACVGTALFIPGFWSWMTGISTQRGMERAQECGRPFDTDPSSINENLNEAQRMFNWGTGLSLGGGLFYCSGMALFRLGSWLDPHQKTNFLEQFTIRKDWLCSE